MGGRDGDGLTEFERVYRAYFDDVYRYILGLSGDAQAAEEITSETFFRAMRAIDRFRGDCDIRVWLCQIAKRCYYTSCKGKTVPMDEEKLAQCPSREHTPEERCMRLEEAAQIRAALHHVPEPYREVFMWRVFAELRFKQIGELFGKSENWACVTYHRARRMIQSRLEESADEQ